MSPKQRTRAVDLWGEPYPGVGSPETKVPNSTSTTTSRPSHASSSRTTVNSSLNPSSSGSLSSNALGKRKAPSDFSGKQFEARVDSSPRNQRPFISISSTSSSRGTIVSSSNIEDSDEDIFFDGNDNDDDNNDDALPSVNVRKTKNTDLWVLTPEAQGQVTVTPLISAIAAPYFAKLKVVGTSLPGMVADGMEGTLVYNHPVALRYLQHLIDIHHGPMAKIEFVNRHHPRAERTDPSRYTYYNTIIVYGETVSIGDVVITPAGQDGPRGPPEIPVKVTGDMKCTVGDFFWFGKILSIRAEDKSAHVQWFQHGRITLLGEFSNPQELYLTYMCDDLDLTSVVGKAKVKYYPPGKRPQKLEWDEFFYSFAYNQLEGSFEDIIIYNDIESLSPPDNCPYCIRIAEKQDAATSSLIKNRKNTPIGISLRGTKYHPYDMVLIRSNDRGPCKIGQIIQILEMSGRGNQDPFKVTVRLFRFFLDLGGVEDEVDNMLIEDRHIYLTNQQLEFDSKFIISKCWVAPYSTINNIHAWLTTSPLNFFIKYVCRERDDVDFNANINRADLEELSAIDFRCCRVCLLRSVKHDDAIFSFREQTEPLRVFDPYAGVGAFELSMAYSGHIKTTHAVEISPSAAKTLKLNSPETIVYNQCSSRVLEYAYNFCHNTDAKLMPIDGGAEALPPPPQPNQFDCIITGFPCQPHSAMNMYKKANDIKSDQILNVLAWVDFLRPKWCCFENVRGFMSYNLGAVQAGPHRVEGGAQKGGLRFLVRVLVTLGYQVRFGLLQAAHYGTPQARVRFFLVAADHGYPLPKLPTPTHNFPLADKLGIKLPNGDFIAPIDTSFGLAPHQYVCVQDAIGDMKPWHWRTPPVRQRERSEQDVELVECTQGKTQWGPINGNSYLSNPVTPFQAHCRCYEKDIKDLQHFTRRFPQDVVKRVIKIPHRAGADYKYLNDSPDLWEYQFANPLSSVARSDHKTVMYGRLDADGWFSTTVTNIGPTAKQARVLHPSCDRVISVRELARSQGFPDHFLFFSKYNDIKMMHRQIGNAIPWQVGEALGRELLEATFIKWKSDKKQKNKTTRSVINQ